MPPMSPKHFCGDFASNFSTPHSYNNSSTPYSHNNFSTAYGLNAIHSAHAQTYSTKVY